MTNTTKALATPDLTQSQFVDGDEIEAADFTTICDEIDDNLDTAAKVIQVSDNDTNVKDLNTALTVSPPLAKAITSPAGDERLQLSIAQESANHLPLILNGSMRFWRAGTSFATLSADTDLADKFAWDVGGGGSGVITVTRETEVPAAKAHLLDYSLKIQVTTADTVIGASELYTLKYVIKSYKTAQLDDVDVVLTFDVRSSRTGTYCLAIKANGETYVVEFTISAADTWETKTVSLTMNSVTTPGDVSLYWVIAAGSSFQQAAGSWISGTSDYCTANQVNGMDSVANDFYITAVRMTIGSGVSDYILPDEIMEFMLLKHEYHVIQLPRFSTDGGSNWYAPQGPVGYAYYDITADANLVAFLVHRPGPWYGGSNVASSGALAVRSATGSIVNISSIALAGALGIDSYDVNEVAVLIATPSGAVTAGNAYWLTTQAASNSKVILS